MNMGPGLGAMGLGTIAPFEGLKNHKFQRDRAGFWRLISYIGKEQHQCPLKNSGDVCKLLKYRVLERKIDGDDLN